MVKKNKYLTNPYDLTKCDFLGEGHNGAVYRLPDGKALKISYNTKNFVREYKILERIKDDRYFPKLYEVGQDYMVREYVEGIPLSKYIKRYGLNKVLAFNIINLLNEFKKLRFKKIDIRCRDILVQPGERIKVIDPKKCYSKRRDFPRHLSKGFYKLGVLEEFKKQVKEYDENLYKKWNKNIDRYIFFYEREKQANNKI